MRVPAIIRFFLIIAAAYAALRLPGILAGKPVPGSLIFLYMFFVAVTTLLVMTATDEGAAGLLTPVTALFTDPAKKIQRNAVLAVIPVVAGVIAYRMTGEQGAPVELRTVHPAPPASIAAYGRTYDLSTLKNPLREIEKKDPARFKELVDEGGAVYFKNCFYCHGDKLDGRGHYARALYPAPLPFTGKDTIAQLQESYVFWRVVKGGVSLPRESGPSTSAMPAWEGALGEDEVWKVIAFIYDYTGNRPRSWEKGQ